MLSSPNVHARRRFLRGARTCRPSKTRTKAPCLQPRVGRRLGKVRRARRLRKAWIASSDRATALHARPSVARMNPAVHDARRLFRNSDRCSCLVSRAVSCATVVAERARIRRRIEPLSLMARQCHAHYRVAAVRSNGPERATRKQPSRERNGMVKLAQDEHETVTQGAKQGERKGREVIHLRFSIPCAGVYGGKRMNTAAIAKKKEIWEK